MTTTANAATKVDDSHIQVEQGDTLSEIAHDNGIDLDQLASMNNIANKNLIHVGDKLVITPQAKNNQDQSINTQVQTSAIAQPQATSQAPAQQTSAPATSNVSGGNGGSMAALRRSIESGGNYNTNTGNGYLGAYQFAPQTIAGIENATGMKWSMDPATQDAFANYYANARYGGWQNTPKTGGW